MLSGFTSCFKKSNIPFIYTAFLKNKSLNIGDFILRMTINVLKCQNFIFRSGFYVQ